MCTVEDYTEALVSEYTEEGKVVKLYDHIKMKVLSID